MTQQPETKAKVGAVIIPVTLFEQNCTLMWCEATKKAVVIDPGGDVPKIQAAIKQANVTVEKIWLTHGHIDHVGGAAELRDALKVPIEGPHIADKFLLDNVVTSGARFGMTGVRDFTPDRWLEEGDQVSIGEVTFDILHCPGHSPGSVVFFNKEMRFAHVGDVLFNGSVGRSDIPGGDHATLIKSITEKLLPLGDDVGFFCGHGARLQHRPGADDQSVSHRRDVTAGGRVADRLICNADERSLPLVKPIYPNHRANPPREMIEIERLGDHLHARLQKAVGDRDALGVTGDEQNLQPGPRFARLVGELAAVDAGQADVGDQQVDLLVRARRIAGPAGPSTASSVR